MYTALGMCMIIHLQKIPQSLHLNAISRRDKVHITVTVSFSFSSFQASDLASQVSVGYFIAPSAITGDSE